MTILSITISIACAYYFYRKSKKVAKPCYIKLSSRLIGKEENELPQDVRITYKERAVDRLTKTTIVIWNDGTEVLKGSDIAQSDPLCLSFIEGDEILSASKIRFTKSANNFCLNNEEGLYHHKMFFSFEYLDPGDGVTLEILHNSLKDNPELVGSVMGVPSGFVDKGDLKNSRNIYNSFFYPFEKNKILGYFVIFSLGFIAILMAYFGEEITSYLQKVYSEEKFTKYVSIMLFLIGLIYVVGPLLYFFSPRKIPKKLDFQ